MSARVPAPSLFRVLVRSLVAGPLVETGVVLALLLWRWDVGPSAELLLVAAAFGIGGGAAFAAAEAAALRWGRVAGGVAVGVLAPLASLAGCFAMGLLELGDSLAATPWAVEAVLGAERVELAALAVAAALLYGPLVAVRRGRARAWRVELAALGAGALLAGALVLAAQRVALDWSLGAGLVFLGSRVGLTPPALALGDRAAHRLLGWLGQPGPGPVRLASTRPRLHLGLLGAALGAGAAAFLGWGEDRVETVADRVRAWREGPRAWVALGDRLSGYRDGATFVSGRARALLVQNAPAGRWRAPPPTAPPPGVCPPLALLLERRSQPLVADEADWFGPLYRADAAEACYLRAAREGSCRAMRRLGALYLLEEAVLDETGEDMPAHDPSPSFGRYGSFPGLRGHTRLPPGWQGLAERRSSQERARLRRAGLAWLRRAARRGDPLALLALARVLDGSEAERREAIACYRELVALGERAAPWALYRLLLRLPEEQRAEDEAWLARLARAERRLAVEAAAGLRPRLPEEAGAPAWARRAAAALEAGRLDAAWAAADEGAATDPRRDEVRAAVCLARACADGGIAEVRLRLAEAHLARARRRDPERAAGWLLSGVRQGLAAALASARGGGGVHTDPASPRGVRVEAVHGATEALLLAALLAPEAGGPVRDALEGLATMVGCAPHELPFVSRPRRLLGETYVRLAAEREAAGEAEAALAALGRALEEPLPPLPAGDGRPARLHVLERRATLLEALGRLEEAVAASLEVTTLVSEDAEAWRELGRRRVLAGDLSQGWSDLERAAALAPQDPELRLWLAALSGEGRWLAGLEGWPAHVARFLEGRWSLAEAEAAPCPPFQGRPSEADRRCVLRWIAGVVAEREGDLARARARYGEALATGQQDRAEYRWARARARALDGRGPLKPASRR